MPAPNAAWIVRLLELQCGTNGLRDLKINVLPGPWMSLVNAPDGFLTNIAQFDSLLQSMIKKGAENYSHIKQDIT